VIRAVSVPNIFCITLGDVIAFHHCGKTWRETIYKDKRFILAHRFRGFHPRLFDSVVLEMVVRQNIVSCLQFMVEQNHSLHFGEEANRKGPISLSRAQP
jgi:hypothetical protein